MNEALRMADLPPEALAVIKEGTPSSKTEPAISKPARENPAPRASEDSQPGLARPEQSEHGGTGKQKALREKERGDNLVRSGLVSLSVRVPTEIPDALVRASADRKVKRQHPFAHQDIAVEALTVWLRKTAICLELQRLNQNYGTLLSGTSNSETQTSSERRIIAGAGFRNRYPKKLNFQRRFRISGQQMREIRLLHQKT